MKFLCFDCIQNILFKKSISFLNFFFPSQKLTWHLQNYLRGNIIQSAKAYKSENCVMKTKHGLEIKELLQKKRLSKSRFNPQSQLSIVNNDRSTIKHPKQIKKVQSATSLHINEELKQKKTATGLQKMQMRYHQLYQQYLKLVDQQKNKTQICKKQSQQITKYQKAAQRDKKEIERLRSMMGFINKKNSSTQTSNLQSKCNSQDITVQSIVGRPSFPQKGLFDFNGFQKQRNQEEFKNNQKNKTEIFKRSTVIENKNPCHDEVRSVRKDNNSRQSKSLNRTASKEFNTVHFVGCKKQFESEKKVLRKYQHFSGSNSKMTESLLYGSKSSIDLRKKRAQHLQNQKNSQLFIEHSQQIIKQSRVNSPNSKYKFVPSVDL